jgi:dienelactone hydrolase
MSRPTALIFAFFLGISSLIFAPLSHAGPPSIWGGLRAGPHDVGFRLMAERDLSRSIQANGTSSGVQTRPLRIYAWYPASISPDSEPMLFGRYADLADDDIWSEEIIPGARQRTAFSRRPLSRSLTPERLEVLLKEPVGAVENAEAVKGPFPLIVVGQGLYYESPITHAILCEHLASQGFVVATVPLAGTDSPLPSLDVIDLETQARDLEFVIGRFRALPFVSGDKLGLLGFDMGGMACLILAMRNPDVDAFASMETAILFADLDIPTASPHHDAARLRAPWLHAVRRDLAASREGTPSLFDTAVHSSRHLLLLEGVGHADFTSYVLVEGRKPMMGYWAPTKGGERERYEAVSLYFSRFFAAYLSGDADSRKFLTIDPEEVAPGLTLTLEHRAATAPATTYSDFRNALLSGDTTGAMETARVIRENQPESPLMQEETLTRLGYRLQLSWELSEAAMAVLKLNTELHPQSTDSFASLGEVYLLNEDDDLAEAALRKSLELDPDNGRARNMLHYLEGKKAQASETD